MNDVRKGFEAFYEHYKELRANEGEKIGHMTICCFDEFPAFILSMQMQDKKLADRYMKNLGEILMTSRSYKTGCWITNQRPDAAYYSNGAREQFHTRVLLTRGMPSKESLSMLGFTREDLKSESYGVGEGIAYIDGRGLLEIKYPHYNVQKIEAEILQYLSWQAVVDSRRLDMQACKSVYLIITLILGEICTTVKKWNGIIRERNIFINILC